MRCGAALVVATLACAACKAPSSPDVPPVTVARPSAQTQGEARTQAPVQAAFVEAPSRVDAPICSHLVIAVVRGEIGAMGETLGTGDVLVVAHPDPVELKGTGLVVRAYDDPPCSIRDKPVPTRQVIRAASIPELRWAGGTMSAHLDVDAKQSPRFYLGRLEGMAPVAEHTHPASWEILAAVDASGTFILDGKEARLGPRQIVAVPPGVKHAWKPDPGAKLVAIQMYAPAGPEQRFIGLAAAASAGRADAGR